MHNNNIVLDTNIFIVYILGQIDPNLINKHSRTGIFNKKHYHEIIDLIGSKKIITCPNIWTEVDNLLKLTGQHKYQYLENIKKIIENSLEFYIHTKESLNEISIFDLGIPDTIILKLSMNASLLISADTKVCDYARSLGINVFDFIGHINKEYK